MQHSIMSPYANISMASIMSESNQSFLHLDSDVDNLLIKQIIRFSGFQFSGWRRHAATNQYLIKSIYITIISFINTHTGCVSGKEKTVHGRLKQDKLIS